MRFGEFLVARKLITEDALAGALEMQREQNRPVGKFAKDLGFVSRRENIMILLQHLKTGKRYGEVAREMGLMNKEQVSRALHFQRESSLLLGKILVNKGVLTRKELVLALKEFVQLNNQTTHTG